MEQCEVMVMDIPEGRAALQGTVEALSGFCKVHLVAPDALEPPFPSGNVEMGVLIVPFDSCAAQAEVPARIARVRAQGARISVLGVAACCDAAARVPLGDTYEGLISLEWVSAPDKIRGFVQSQEAGRRTRAIELFLDSALDGFWYWDIRRDRLDWSDRTCEVVGIPSSAAPANIASFKALIDPLDLDRVEQAIRNHLYHGSPYRNIGMRLRRPDGSYGSFVANGQALFDATGQPIVLAGSLTDRTFLQQVEQQLEDTTQRFTVLFHRMNDAAVLADIETGLLLEANEPAERLWGKSIAELVGSHQSSLHPPNLSADAREVFRRHVEALMKNRRDAIEVPILRKDGTEVPTEISSSLVEIGGKTMILGVFRDTTERRKAEQEIRERDAQLQLSSHLAAMGTLAAGVAHEINNPLTYMLGNLELLREATATDPAAPTGMIEALEAAITGGRYLREIVADLKAISRSEATDGSCDPCEVLRVATRMAMSDLRHRAVVDCDLQPVPRVALSSGRLTQVLLNLLSNAARSFEKRDRSRNRVTITTRAVDQGVQIVLADNGTGIAPADLRRVFEPFFSRHHGSGGTGLGLPICRRILTEAGGSLVIESEPGKGTRVTMLLPVASQVAAVPVAIGPLAAGPEDRRVMIVDDDPLVARLTAQLLGKDMAVSAFTDPVAALEVLRRAPGDWALVLCDLMMPDLDGAAFYDAARALPAPVPEFLFITGGAVTERCIAFEREMTQAGRVLLKPFEAAELRRKVSDLLALRGTSRMADGGAQAAIPAALPGIATYVVQELEAVLGGKVLTEQYQRLQADLAVARGDIATALAADRYSEIVLIAHRIAGAAGFLGLPDLNRTLCACEVAARQADAAAVTTGLERLAEAEVGLAMLIGQRTACAA